MFHEFFESLEERQLRILKFIKTSKDGLIEKSLLLSFDKLVNTQIKPLMAAEKQ